LKCAGLRAAFDPRSRSRGARLRAPAEDRYLSALRTVSVGSRVGRDGPPGRRCRQAGLLWVGLPIFPGYRWSPNYWPVREFGRGARLLGGL